MKTAAVGISTALALLLAAGAQAQSPFQPQIQPRVPDSRGSIGGPGFMRPPHPARPPSMVRPPFFWRHPFFFGSGPVVQSSEAAVPSTILYGYPTPVYVPYPAYSQPQPQYWAYCRSAQAYYPYVAECAGGWLPVLPTSTPPPARVSDDLERGLTRAPAGSMPIEELRERIARSRAD